MPSQYISWAVCALLAWRTRTVAAQDPESELKAIPLRTHTLQTPFIDTDMQSRWWDYGGSTVIRTDQYVRLTAQQPSQAGWIFSRVPLTATHWEIEVEFKISGTGNLYGDGMAMWVTTSRTEGGTVFGMKDEFEGLGLFFDTYKNNRPGVVFPYVMAMVGDGKTKYDQINDGKANELAGCSARGIRNADVPTKARVTYFHEKELTVDLMYKKDEEWTNCFTMPNVKLPPVTYLGFSAETGELSDNHDILKVQTTNMYSPARAKASGTESQASRAKYRSNIRAKQRGSWFWIIMRFVAVGLVVAGGYAGYTAYRTRRRDRF